MSGRRSPFWEKPIFRWPGTTPQQFYDRFQEHFKERYPQYDVPPITDVVKDGEADIELRRLPTFCQDVLEVCNDLCDGYFKRAENPRAHLYGADRQGISSDRSLLLWDMTRLRLKYEKPHVHAKKKSDLIKYLDRREEENKALLLRHNEPITAQLTETQRQVLVGRDSNRLHASRQAARRQKQAVPPSVPSPLPPALTPAFQSHTAESITQAASQLSLGVTVGPRQHAQPTPQQDILVQRTGIDTRGSSEYLLDDDDDDFARIFPEEVKEIKAAVDEFETRGPPREILYSNPSQISAGQPYGQQFSTGAQLPRERRVLPANQHGLATAPSYQPPPHEQPSSFNLRSYPPSFNAAPSLEPSRTFKANTGPNPFQDYVDWRDAQANQNQVQMAPTLGPSSQTQSRAPSGSQNPPSGHGYEQSLQASSGYPNTGSGPGTYRHGYDQQHSYPMEPPYQQPGSGHGQGSQSLGSNQSTISLPPHSSHGQQPLVPGTQTPSKPTLNRPGDAAAPTKSSGSLATAKGGRKAAPTKRGDQSLPKSGSTPSAPIPGYRPLAPKPSASLSAQGGQPSGLTGQRRPADSDSPDSSTKDSGTKDSGKKTAKKPRKGN